MTSRRAVFDTNILISGYLWKGVARQALEKVRGDQWIHLVSKDTVDELIRVLAYAKFNLTAAEIDPIVQDLLGMSEFVNVKSRVEIVSADPTDNIFLELALDGKANVIVSGDHHLLDLKTFNAIPILSIRKFLTYQIRESQ